MYNTDINILGGVPNYDLIYKALPHLIEGKEEVQTALIDNNEFDFRTERSRIRFFTLLKSAFISENPDVNNWSSELIQFLKNDEKSQALVIFWLFSLNNKLFFDLNRDVYFNYYYQGRTELPKADVVAYLKDKLATNSELKEKWSENTINTVAYKYLSVLKKMHLLEGSRKKTFHLVRINDEMLAAFIHLLDIKKPYFSNALEDDFLQFSFVPNENIISRLKKIGKKDWIKINQTGTSLKLEGFYEPNQLIDGIFRRA
ncbi:BrxA family protein [Salegentibacter maritimus]|uniref:DUF1819 family protein n=1 Tax=Salegentibacter maritimus TaxID=2794347 RepID=A0ABS0TJ37_9FLAO|nr:BrxA family protein [Salegentibacter maritimus]MBI6121037.1 DUF1819 family protein [Salegentibacter maritimus]